jgi:hypothetical protein
MKLRLLPLLLVALFTLTACASGPKREPKAPGEHTNHHHDR